MNNVTRSRHTASEATTPMPPSSRKLPLTQITLPHTLARPAPRLYALPSSPSRWLASFDSVAFDMDGVLWRGDEPIAHAGRCIRALQRASESFPSARQAAPHAMVLAFVHQRDGASSLLSHTHTPHLPLSIQSRAPSP